MQEARHQLHLDITDKHTTLELDAECYRLNNNSDNIGFQVNPTRTVKGSVTPETWDSFSNYNKLRAEAEMKASKHLREAIFATLKQTANDLEAQRQATEYSFRKRIHETNQTRSELEWQQKNVTIDHFKIMRALMSFPKYKKVLRSQFQMQKDKRAKHNNFLIRFTLFKNCTKDV